MNYEIIGIAASLFVITSFLMKTRLYIRSINAVGAALFVIYGALIGSYSIMFLNAALIFIQIYRTAQLLKRKDRLKN
ncbi:MAG: hypothetical protein LBH81_03855 [Rickettsiales bacterium]|jgi:hypothetical protein|nr:hypothetical protein [Rickettsiales bacterium]